VWPDFSIVAAILGLIVAALYAGRCADHLLDRERHYRERTGDDKQTGLIATSSDSQSFLGEVLENFRCQQWVFNTPSWVGKDNEAQQWLRRMRISAAVGLGFLVIGFLAAR